MLIAAFILKVFKVFFGNPTFPGLAAAFFEILVDVLSSLRMNDQSAGQSSQNGTRTTEIPILSTAQMASDLWQSCVMLNNTTTSNSVSSTLDVATIRNFLRQRLNRILSPTEDWRT